MCSKKLGRVLRGKGGCYEEGGGGWRCEEREGGGGGVIRGR